MTKTKSPFEAFSDSGRFINRAHYLEKHPDSVLHTNCTDVIVYFNFDENIQLLKSGEFYYDENIRGYFLDDVELELFAKKIQKIIVP
jgi:hypothetical protein